MGADIAADIRKYEWRTIMFQGIYMASNNFIAAKLTFSA
jgi:hypothetical protein